MPEIVACPFLDAGNGADRALDPTLDLTYTFLIEWLSEQATLFDDPLINVYGDEVRFECWNQSQSIKAWMESHNIAKGDFQGLTEVFWKRFAKEVAPAVFNRTNTSMMIGEANVDGTDGPPFALPTWLQQAMPTYPLPLTVEVWGGHTLERNENGTLRKTLSVPGMQAVIGGAYYLDQDLPRPYNSGGESKLVYRAPYWVSVWRTMYSFEPLGDPALTDEQRSKVIGLVAEMWGEQINSGTVENRIFPHALAMAERGWSSVDHFHPNGTAHVWSSGFYAQVEGRLNLMSCTLNRRGIQSSPSAPGHCSWSQTSGV
jgi:hexosaminidase